MSVFKKIFKGDRDKRKEQEGSMTDRQATKKERSGLFLLKEDAVGGDGGIDLIAIHGLGGDWMDTWSDEQANWLRDFLPPALTGKHIAYRVFSYGYNSTTAFTAAVTDLDDEAAMLLDRIRGERREAQMASRPIILIAHSLGGILLKKAMILAHERSQYYAELLSAIKGAVFFGTPHRGSDLAYWATFAATLANVVQLGRNTNTTYVKGLKENSKEFAHIAQQWIERGSKLQIRTFYETERYNGMLVVDKASALLGLNNEIAVGIAESNHRTMCKFSDSNSQKYRPVKIAVEDLVQNAVQTLSPQYALAAGDQTLLQALYLKDPEEYREQIMKPEKNTCKWIYGSPQYQLWNTSDTSTLLLISADPGCGKSVLASSLVEHFQECETEQQTFCCYFFFKDDNDNQNSLNVAIRSILYQLLSTKPHLLPYFAREHAKKGKQILDAPTTLWNIFLQCLGDKTCGVVILILDGLDECEISGARRLLDLVTSYYRNTERSTAHKSQLKTILSSRPYQYIRDAFWDTPTVQLKMEDHVDLIDSDIRSVVNARIDRFASSRQQKDDPKLENLRDLLLLRAGSFFLWVTLILDMLESEGGPSYEELGAIVESSAPTLPSIYDKMLGRIKSREKCRKLLRIVLSAREYLTLEEIDHAWAIRPEDTSMKDMQPRRFLSAEYAVKDISGLFLRIINGRVFLVHQTARAYLLNLKSGSNESTGQDINTTNPISSWQHSFRIADCYSLMAVICITYLSLEDITKLDAKELRERSGVDDVHESDISISASDEVPSCSDSESMSNGMEYLEDQYPLLLHASREWIHYYTASSRSESVQQTEPRVLSLLRPGADAWLELYLCWPNDYRSVQEAQNAQLRKHFTVVVPRTLLGRAAYFGLSHVYFEAVSDAQGMDLNVADERGNTILFYAIVGGNRDVIEHQFSMGWDATISVCSFSESTIQSGVVASVLRDDLRATKWLLDHHPSPNACSRNGRPLLSLVQSSDMVSLLLEKGADIDYEVSNSSGTAFQQSICEGGVVLFRTLLGMGFSPDRLGVNFSLIRIAVEFRNYEAVQLMLHTDTSLGLQHLSEWSSVYEELLTCGASFSRGVMAKFLESGVFHHFTGELARISLQPQHQIAEELYKEFLQEGRRSRVAKAARQLSPGLLEDVKQYHVNDSFDRIEKLANHGALVQVRVKRHDGTWETLLHAACRSTQLSVVGALVQNGADVRAYNEAGHSALISLCSEEHADGHELGLIISLLLAFGADIDEADEDGRTPLLLCIMTRQDSDSVAALVDSGADVHHRDRQGRNVLDMITNPAREHYDDTHVSGDLTWKEDVLRHLGRHGIDVNMVDANGHSFLELVESEERESGRNHMKEEYLHRWLIDTKTDTD